MNIAALCLVLLAGLTARSMAFHLYPYGPLEGDSSVPRSDDDSSPLINLECRYGFYGNYYSSLYINVNGHLTFDYPRWQFWPPVFPFGGWGSVMIAPFYSDIDISYEGYIYYRESTDPALLSDLKAQINCPSFSPTCAFVVTWVDVEAFGDHYYYSSYYSSSYTSSSYTSSSYYSSSYSSSSYYSSTYYHPSMGTNTFQVVLVTDGSHTFAIFKYDEIEHAYGEASVDEYAVVGFNAGDSMKSWQHPDSYTSSILDIESTSNVYHDGCWVFRIDGDMIMDYHVTYCPESACVETVTPAGADGICNCEVSCVCILECPLRPACTVGIGAPNQVNSFDGFVDYMPTANKFLISSYGVGAGDQCSFRLRVDTDDDGSGHIDVGFTGVGFGVHHGNPYDGDFERNFRVFKNNHDAEIRGRGYSSPEDVLTDGCYQTGPFPEFWFFCVSYPDDKVVHITGSVPSSDCWFWVTVMQPGAPDNPYNHEIVWLDAAPFYDDQLIGMCGNRDGEADNDADFCFGPHPGFPNDHICIDGEHQFNEG